MRLDRKAFGRIATTFVATAMLAAFAAVPAMAAEPAANEFVIPKTFTVAANTFRPAADFRFTVAAANVTAEENGYYNGIEGAVKLKTPASFAAETSNTPSSTPTSMTANATFEVTFGQGGITHAGTYKYTLKEDASSPVAGVTYDTNTYDLYVVVVNEDTAPNKLKVQSVFMTNHKEGTQATGETKVIGITNTYGNTTGGANTLTLTKVIDGKGADKSAAYDFTIKITSSSPATTKYYYETSDGQEKGVITSGDTGVTVTLSNDERVTVYGLLDNDTYEIAETNANADQYTTTVKMENDSDYTDYTDALTGKMSTADTDNDDNVDITVKNFRDLDDIPTTGVLLNVAPYALMVIIAAAGCFVFLRKRRDD